MCPDSVPVTVVKDHLNIYSTANTLDFTPKTEYINNTATVISEKEVLKSIDTKINFSAIVPFVIMSIVYFIFIVVGIYLDTVKETNKIIPTDSM